MMFIILTLRAKNGYHPSDASANTEVHVNINKIDYYYTMDDNGAYASIISIAGTEFKCKENIAEISEKIEAAEIAASFN